MGKRAVVKKFFNQCIGAAGVDPNPTALGFDHFKGEFKFSFRVIAFRKKAGRARIFEPEHGTGVGAMGGESVPLIINISKETLVSFLKKAFLQGWVKFHGPKVTRPQRSVMDISGSWV